ncbi:MAG TPA: hypothetical protein VLV17_04360 [Anaeromyxobacteraceae bacterium]|nr:hypothetical protein [Anaeromyxobacteraceae bacterium]
MVSGGPRFGLRQHFACAPWTDAVEVYFGDGVEAYLTPVGPACIGVAFLCESFERASYEKLLLRFPELKERLASSPRASTVAGVGPLARAARARSRDRLVLLGDAAGYLDAITGEGLSLALKGAAELGELLPEALKKGAARECFLAFERAEARRFALYAHSARAVLGLARRPRARRRALDFLGRHPRLFSALVAAVVGAGD